jgi:hypothetical protein
MKDLFDTAVANEVGNRIACLRPDGPKYWGAMNAAQMLAHCSAWMAMAEGTTSQKQSLLGRVFGKMAKRSLLGTKPIRQNMPTDKTLVISGERDFAVEQQRLLEQIKRFAEGGPEHCTTHPHSFFGVMTPREWATMGYKHLDHHLRQFGV